MQLSEEQIAGFFRDGYVVCRDLADPATIAQVRDLGERTFTAGGGGGEQRRWTPAIFDHDQPRQDAELHALLRDPAIYGAASQLLGGAPARVYYGMLAVVPPDGGTGLPWVRSPGTRPPQLRQHCESGLLCACSTRTTCTRTCWAVR